MKCRDIKLHLPLFTDNVLSEDERRNVESHLVRCPLCRQKLSDYQELRSCLRSVARPQIPFKTLESIRAAVGDALAMPTPAFRLIESKRSWPEVWLVPSAIGSAASLIIGLMLLAAMLSPEILPTASTALPASSSDAIYLANGSDESFITAAEYAHSRMSVAGQSPSLNPRGALVALTNSLVRGEMKDDEVVVVADVFGNGLAQIAEVVKPSRDRRVVAELQKALQSDPAFAPFVSAEMDRRADPVRVVLKIQSVNVETRLTRRRR